MYVHLGVGLLGQVAQCPRDLQAVTDIVEENLARYDIDFPGWTGVVRKTATTYGLDDPLELLQQPWRADRWRQHCKKVITEYWVKVLHESCQSYTSLDLFDVSRLLLEAPHPIWVAAGRDSYSTSQAVYQLWLLLGVYNTQERLARMKKVKSADCVLCPDVGDSPMIEDRVHFLLSCPALAETRDNFMSQLGDLSPVVVKYRDETTTFLLSLLDPLSPMLPQELRSSWSSDTDIYKWSRKFCYAMHKKRTKLIESVN